LATFFLIYSVVVLFRLVEADAMKASVLSKEINSTLKEKGYNIYKLPRIKFLTQIAVFFTLVTSFFLVNYIGCQLVQSVSDCKLSECVEVSSMDQEIYIIGYTLVGVYLVFLSVKNLLKAYKP
jgi:hypothetical protein